METTYNRFKKILKKYRIPYSNGITETTSFIKLEDKKEGFTIKCIFNEGNLIEIIQNEWIKKPANEIDFIGIKNNNYEIKILNKGDLLGQLNLKIKLHDVEFA